MKKKTLAAISAAACILVLAGYTVLKTSGSHPGSTGAPGDLTCAQSGCHVTASVTQDSGLVNKLLFSSNDSTYVPGNTYTLTLQVTKAAISKFGFELVALKDSTNTNIGAFSLLETTRTQKLNYMAAGGLRYSITHKTAGTGTATPGAIQWKMKWTAPPANAGTITFWYASNCTNNNGLNTGDQVFLSHFQIRPYEQDSTGGNDSVTTSIRQPDRNMDMLRVYQELNSRYLSVNFSSYSEQEGRIIVYDIAGKVLLDVPARFVPGHNMHRVELPAECCEGAYLVKVQGDGMFYANKIILRK